MPNYQVEFHANMQSIPASEWNALVSDNNPFVRHEFLQALETNHCVSPRFGWIPHHMTVHQDGQLIAALPLYEKHNNYGEFVFDHSWAEAWEKVGLPYYPKLVSAVPYSPVTGPRMLIHPHQDSVEPIQAFMFQQLKQYAEDKGFSGWHCLFANQNEQAWLSHQSDILTRHDCHFHWFNHNYANFDDFLALLTAKKRKNIRQERASLEKSQIQIRVLNGHTASDQDWEQFSFFYYKTFTEKWSTPTLNKGFFMEVACALPDQTVLVLADDAHGQCIAGALMYRSDSVLYGRHWGCIQEVKNLHFEACYYQGIEYAIQHGLRRFEPGAGGEHKIARGFVPVQTQSAHWLANNPFPEGMAHFLKAEKQAIDEYYQECQLHSPYKSQT
ncbi:MAG: GNAT family N-acetyltransferase [Thiomicrorhabdus chilensis]|uniref:GNAT family N-acetyltransferase n=1 Tax=Thiomicrorhabdus chilensis TaxID=63656 RepID=UPI00299CD53B|nr:GNAT family N-acetyltransferase [Thiomicrorhabdus chilensis]MDX1348438.1 GNAT family N-acetyltransferase [Thiomicrorhabdus chilensis]